MGEDRAGQTTTTTAAATIANSDMSYATSDNRVVVLYVRKLFKK